MCRCAKKGNSFLFHLIDCQWIQCRRKVQSSRKLGFLHGDHALKHKSRKFNHYILYRMCLWDYSPRQ